VRRVPRFSSATFHGQALMDAQAKAFFLRKLPAEMPRCLWQRVAPCAARSA